MQYFLHCYVVKSLDHHLTNSKVYHCMTLKLKDKIFICDTDIGVIRKTYREKSGYRADKIIIRN